MTRKIITNTKYDNSWFIRIFINNNRHKKWITYYRYVYVDMITIIKYEQGIVTAKRYLIINKKSIYDIYNEAHGHGIEL